MDIYLDHFSSHVCLVENHVRKCRNVRAQVFKGLTGAAKAVAKCVSKRGPILQRIVTLKSSRSHCFCTDTA